MPNYSFTKGGQTYHFEWNEKREPTEAELNKIADKLIRQKELESPIKHFAKQGVKGALKTLEEIKEGPVGQVWSYAFSPPDVIEDLRKQGQERIAESEGPTPSIKSGNVQLDTFAKEAQRNIASEGLNYLTPTRFDIATLGLGLAAKPALKYGAKALPEIEEAVKFMSGLGHELGGEAGVFKFGGKTGSPKPRWKSYELQFANDEDKAAYILAGKGKSAQHDLIADAIQQEGLDLNELMQRGMKIRDTLKKVEGTAIDNVITVPSHSKGSRIAGTAPRDLGTNPRAIKAAEEQLDDIVDLVASGENAESIAQKLNLKPGTVESVLKKHKLVKKDEDITNAVNKINQGEEEIKLVEPEITPNGPPQKPPSLDNQIPPEPPSEPPPTHRYGGGREPFRWQDLKDLAGPFQRSLQSMGEMSFPFRQGRVALAAHPSQAPAVFKGMFKGFKDPSYADEVVDEIYNRPFARIPEFVDQGDELIPTTRNLYKEAKLGISDPSDVFPSNLAHQIPGIAQLSKRSEAAYGIGADTLRANLFDQVLAKHGFDPSNLPSDEQVKQFGNYVNTVTGYGRGGGAFEGAVPAMQFGLYSPRYQKSQLDILNPVNYTGMTDRFGKLGAQELAKDVGKFGAVAGAGLAGADYALGDKADVNWNPFDTDFAKLRIGDTRIDPLGPLGSYPRWGLKMANELGKNVIGDSYEKAAGPILGQENVETKNDPLWNTSNMIRGKLAPGLPSFGADMLIGKGKNVVGDPLEDMPFSFPGLGANHHFETPYLGYGLSQSSPLFYQDIAEIEDRPTQAAAAPLGFFGANINTYKAKERKKKGQANPYAEVENLYKKLYGQ